MSQDQKPKEHIYDGIVEHDNALPNWWLVTFFATIIFSFVYYIHYTFGGGPTLTQELEVAMAKLPQQTTGQFSETELEQKFSAFASIDEGQAVFAGKCASCHAAEGQGLIGPNLTDKFWIHGKGLRADIVNVIAQGVIEKGMPAWSAALTENELLQVSAFVFKMRLSPKAGKEAQGTEVQ